MHKHSSINVIDFTQVQTGLWSPASLKDYYYLHWRSLEGFNTKKRRKIASALTLTIWTLAVLAWVLVPILACKTLQRTKYCFGNWLLFLSSDINWFWDLLSVDLFQKELFLVGIVRPTGNLELQCLLATFQLVFPCHEEFGPYILFGLSLSCGDQPV